MYLGQMPHLYKHAQLCWLQENYTYLLLFVQMYWRWFTNHAQLRPLPLHLNWAWNLTVQTEDSFLSCMKASVLQL